MHYREIIKKQVQYERGIIGDEEAIEFLERNVMSGKPYEKLPHKCGTRTGLQVFVQEDGSVDGYCFLMWYSR